MSSSFVSSGGDHEYVDGYYTKIYDSPILGGVDDGSLSDGFPNGRSDNALVGGDCSASLASQPRDWNEEFQSLLDKLRATREEDEELRVYQSLSRLASDFAFVTKTYAKIIILERYLPKERKTIKPIDIGGMAGGEKYISNGILFKFAVDKHNLYGGDDGLAMKSANHELHGLLAYYGAQIEGLHVPLMSIIDYRGFRVVAMSILPLSFSSIVYGSNNGGRSVHNKCESTRAKMSIAADKINIKSHIVGRGGVSCEICGPVDIEAHVGLDGRCYVLDFARVFPPEANARCEEEVGSFMYKLLRPELVKRNELPLSSDAFSPFGKHNRSIHDGEVRSATHRLHSEVIPQFSRWLDAQFDGRKKKPPVLDISQAMHRAGVNMRHLGRVRRHTNSESSGRLLLHEMLSRLIKCELRRRLRSKMQEIRMPMREVYRDTVVRLLNRLLGASEESMAFWSVEVKGMLQSKFVDSLSERERLHDLHLRSKVDFHVLLMRVCDLTGLCLSENCLAQVKQNASAAGGITLAYQDVVKMKAKTKQMDIVSFAEGASYCIRAVLAREDAKEESDRLFQFAYSSFKKALASTPDNDAILQRWGDALVQQALGKVGNARRSKLASAAMMKYAQTSSSYSNCIDAADAMCSRAMKYSGEERSLFYRLAADFYGMAQENAESCDWELALKRATLLCRQADDGADRIEPSRRKSLLCQAADLFDDALRIRPDCLPHVSAGWRDGVPREIYAQSVYVTQRLKDVRVLDVRSCSIGPTPSDLVDGVVRSLLLRMGRRITAVRASGQPLSNAAFPSRTTTSRAAPAPPHARQHAPLAPAPRRRPNPPPTRVHRDASGGSSMPSSTSLRAAPSSTAATAARSKRMMVHRGAKRLHRPHRPPLQAMRVAKHQNAIDVARRPSELSITFSCSYSSPPNIPDGGGVDSASPLIHVDGSTSIACDQRRVLDGPHRSAGPREDGGSSTGHSNDDDDDDDDGGGDGGEMLFHHLVELDLSCTRVDGGLFPSVFASCPNLCVLDLRDCNRLGDASLAATLSNPCAASSRAPAGGVGDDGARARAALPFLSELHLSRCARLSDRALHHLLAQAPNVQALSLAHCRSLSDGGIAGGLARCTRLARLDVSHTLAGASTLGTVATRCSRLVALTAKGCSGLGTRHRALADVVHRCPALHTIALGGGPAVPEMALLGMVRALSSMAMVHALPFATTTTTTDSSRTSTDMMVNPDDEDGNANSHAVFHHRHHHHHHHGVHPEPPVGVGVCPLSVLDVSRCSKVSDAMVVDVARACPMLHTVNLDGCRSVTDVAVRALHQRCVGVRRLRLSDCYAVRHAVEELARAGHLTHLSINGCDRLTPGTLCALARHCPGLAVLEARKCVQFTAEGFAMVFGACRSLSVVDVAHCKNISSKAVRALAQCAALASVTLSRCTGFAADALEHVAKRCAALQSLQVAECKQITDAAIRAVARHCRRMGTWVLTNCAKLTDAALISISEFGGDALRRLKVSGCHRISDEGVCRVARMCTHLEALHLGRLYKITDVAVVLLSRYACSTLQVLVLNGCSNVSDVSVLRLLGACSRLSMLNVDSCKVSRNAINEIRRNYPNVTIGRPVPTRTT